MNAPAESPKKRPKWLRLLALIILFIPIFPFLLYRVVKMINAQDSENPEDLVREIHRVNKISQLIRGKHPEISTWYRARIAEQWVLQNRLEEAQREFSKIREELKGKSSKQAKYTRYFCSYWLANIRGDPGQAEYEVRQAAKLSYRSGFLWLPEPRGTDDFNLEFDHELLQAAENAGMTVEDFLLGQTIKH